MRGITSPVPALVGGAAGETRPAANAPAWSARRVRSQWPGRSVWWRRGPEDRPTRPSIGARQGVERREDPPAEATVAASGAG